MVTALDQKAVCIIGARQDSQRLPGKNKALLANQPLFVWTVEAAVDSGLFGVIIFSTDDEEILESLHDHPEVLADPRPKDLADARASMWDVGAYVIKKHAAVLQEAEAVCFLTPCHPFRNKDHLRQAHQRYQTSKAQALLSVTEFPSPPALALDLTNGRLRRDWSGLVRQAEHHKKYYPNGAITIIDRAYFEACQTPYSDATVGFEMDWPDCLDIDEPKDLALAIKLAPVMWPGRSGFKV